MPPKRSLTVVWDLAPDDLVLFQFSRPGTYAWYSLVCSAACPMHLRVRGFSSTSSEIRALSAQLAQQVGPPSFAVGTYWTLQLGAFLDVLIREDYLARQVDFAPGDFDVEPFVHDATSLAALVPPFSVQPPLRLDFRF